MRLLTHNMLQCPRTKKYPLSLEAHTCDDTEVPFSEAFVRRMIARLDWSVFRDAAMQLPDPDMLALLPEEIPDGVEQIPENVLRAIHRAMLEWHIVDGTLSNDDGYKYSVKNGIPNLVITEVRKDEKEDENEEESDEDMEIEGEEDITKMNDKR